MHGCVDAARHGQLAGEAQVIHIALSPVRPNPRACRSALPRRPSGFWGWPCRPSPVCTSALQGRARLARSRRAAAARPLRAPDFACLGMRFPPSLEPSRDKIASARPRQAMPVHGRYAAIPAAGSRERICQVETSAAAAMLTGPIRPRRQGERALKAVRRGQAKPSQAMSISSLSPAAMAGLAQSDLWMRTPLDQPAKSATVYSWFLSS